jgi:hypothetical protein
MRASTRALLLAVALSMSLLSGRAEAQGFRGRSTTAFHYVQLQPVAQDTVSRVRVTEEPDGRLTFEGRPVTCTPGLGCTFYRVQPEQGALAATQDVSATVWGLGTPGLSATALLRGRVRFDGELVWPRSDDAFDVLLAYAELQRWGLRLRAGRQETLSGLGFAGFDGASARWTPLAWLALEGYGGRSLARGLDEPQHEALRGVEDFIPDRNAFLFGAFASAAGAAGSVGWRYQREIWSDRSGLLQERASLDAASAYFRPLRIEGALDWDVALARVGKAHVTASYPIATADLVLEATVRRYAPYFQLSTIWGFFSPVPYHEALLRASFAPPAGISARATLGWRRYGDPDRSDFLSPLTGDGWRAEATLARRLAAGWTADATYRIEWGAGAFLSAVDGSVLWSPRDGIDLGVTGTAFQQILEFRVGEGRVWGSGLTLGLDLPRGARLDGGAALYRHGPRGRATETPWNQTRAWTTISVGFGDEPGLRADRRLRR